MIWIVGTVAGVFSLSLVAAFAAMIKATNKPPDWDNDEETTRTNKAVEDAELHYGVLEDLEVDHHTQETARLQVIAALNSRISTDKR